MLSPESENLQATQGAYRVTRVFQAVREDRPGVQWQQILGRSWGEWRQWYLARGATTARSEAEAMRAIRRHMPEMERLIDTLAGFLPDDPELREFLTFWCPPRYLVSCTQAASVDQAGPFLIRNYDLDPELSEATLLLSNWRGKAVMGMVEGMAGLSDGINENGLAISLSFGGRLVTGRGFGIPLIMRYVLETCTDVQDAIDALRLIPCHMSYNVTMTDASGAAATAFLAPDRRAMINRTSWATNHQLGVEWPRHGRISATLERASHLSRCYQAGLPTEASLRHAFLHPPFFSRHYRLGYGTVFSTSYRPLELSMSMIWGDGDERTWRIGGFEPSASTIEYSDAGSRLLAHSLLSEQ
ncbi:C45 family peptidase [Ruegeria sp.]|uniref:C45 family peptidase n=1 Tax=Ruegeria sp. TaxID=1879320 RepID=UPI00231A7CD7|nr:C45 family peptidase [Ruegeria sp.]MDA7963446.1 C45 family autoproteolytic acyltransferase/hydrolase [Ruegeria sp.]